MGEEDLETNFEVELTIVCGDCGGEYVVDDEGASDHEPGCSVREAKIGTGEWEEPDDA